jgi:TRAP transporter 4TM/12TM fusion protein
MADPELGAFREPGGPAQVVQRGLAVALTVVGLLYVLHVPGLLRIALFREQYLGVMIGLALGLTFLSVPATHRSARHSVPWYDWLLAGGGVLVGGYVAVLYPVIAYRLAEVTPEKWLLGLVAIVLFLEATRRLAGRAVMLVGLLFILYARFGSALPEPLQANPARWDRLLTYLYLDSNGLLGVPLTVATTVVLAYVLLGQVLSVTGGAAFLADFALATMGRFRGGPAKMSIVSSSLFGTVSGSAVANVAVDGPITIPMMKRTGYPPYVAAAVEATASTGGQIMPPVMGVAAFLIAEFLRIRYAEVAAAALIPALLYYTCLFFQVDLEAAKLGLRGLAKEQVPELRGVLRRGLVFGAALAVVIYGLYGAKRPAEDVGVLAAGFAFLVAVLTRRARIRGVGEILGGTGRALLGLAAVSGVAGLIIGTLQFSGLGFRMALLLTELAGQNLFALLLLTAAAAMVLGMGMPTVAVYVLLAAVVAPALVQLGVLPLAAHLFVFYFGMLSMITPPVCLATYTAAAIAGADFWRAGWAGMRLAAVAYVVPFLFVYEPALLGRADPWTVGIACATAVAGTFLLAAALVGYWFGPLTGVERILLLACALALITPETGRSVLFSWVVEIAGGIGAVGIGLRNWRRELKQSRQAFSPSSASSASVEGAGQGAPESSSTAWIRASMRSWKLAKSPRARRL